MEPVAKGTPKNKLPNKQWWVTDCHSNSTEPYCGRKIPPGSRFARSKLRQFVTTENPRRNDWTHRQVVSPHRNLPPLQIEDFFYLEVPNVNRNYLNRIKKIPIAFN
jgi:hypothetical protein